MSGQGGSWTEGPTLEIAPFSVGFGAVFLAPNRRFMAAFAPRYYLGSEVFVYDMGGWRLPGLYAAQTESRSKGHAVLQDRDKAAIGFGASREFAPVLIWRRRWACWRGQMVVMARHVAPPT
jgi:hypothetical protein